MEPATLDLQYLRDLLQVLSEFGVAEFSCPDFKVGFRGGDFARPTALPEPDNAAVPEAEGTGWAHPSLWAATGGKRLSFDGSVR